MQAGCESFECHVAIHPVLADRGTAFVGSSVSLPACVDVLEANNILTNALRPYLNLLMQHMNECSTMSEKYVRKKHSEY